MKLFKSKNINITPLLILIIIDIFGLHKLWNERIDRRLLHHIQSSNFNFHFKPKIFILKNVLSKQEIDKVVSIKLPNNKKSNTVSPLLSWFSGGLYSKRSSIYYSDFDIKTQQYLDSIALKIKPLLEKKCGEKLNFGLTHFRAVFLRYEGKYSFFPWHYDTEPYNCYRTLILIKKKGNISKFLYKNENKKTIKLDFKLGEGIFFKGTQTYHAVEKNKDSNSVRWMLGFQYYSGNKIINSPKSLCSELSNANMFKIIKLFLPRIILLNVIILFSNKKLSTISINRKSFTIINTLIIASSFILPKFLLKNGTGRVSTLKSTIIFLIGSQIIYFDIFKPLGHLSYLLLTEMLLPKKIVEKTIINGGS